MTSDQARERIRKAAAKRAKAEADKAAATVELAKALIAAQDTAVTQTEAARLAGLSRKGALDLARRYE